MMGYRVFDVERGSLHGDFLSGEVSAVQHSKTVEVRLSCDYCPDTDFPAYECIGRQTEAAAFQSAKNFGWRVYPRWGKAKCPACVAVGPTAAPNSKKAGDLAGFSEEKML